MSQQRPQPVLAVGSPVAFQEQDPPGAVWIGGLDAEDVSPSAMVFDQLALEGLDLLQGAQAEFLQQGRVLRDDNHTGFKAEPSAG